MYLVLSGGGMKGLALIGLLTVLEKYKLNNTVKGISGASIGALFGLLLSIGYSSEELYSLVENFDYEKLSDIDITDFFSKFGIDTGGKICLFVKALIRSKKFPEDLTFSEHYERTGIWLVMNSICLNTREVEYFDYKNTPDMPIWMAIRMTVSLPFLFYPIPYKGNMYVDGGLTDNFPISPFIAEEVDKSEIIGVKLQSHPKKGNNNTEQLGGFISSVWDCVFQEMNRLKIEPYEQDGYRIIYIVNNQISAFNLDISVDDRKVLYNDAVQLGTVGIDKYIFNEVEDVLENIISNIEVELSSTT